MDALWNNIFVALGAAIMAALYAYTNFIKSENGEALDWGKLFRTIGLAAIAGFVVSFWRMPENIIIESPIYAMAGILLENLGKWIKRKVFPTIKAIAQKQ